MKTKQSLYEIIYNDIVNKIKLEHYAVGDLLPSEADLEKSYKTSRTPVRQALKQLEYNGYIYRLQGKGSFVANINPSEKWILTTGFMHQYNKDRDKISAQTLEITKIKDPNIASLLKIDEQQQFYSIKRIRYYNNEPVLYLNHFLNPLIPVEIFSNTPEFSSKDQLLKEIIDVGILDIQEKIESVNADSEVSGMLKIPDQAPVLKITRISSALHYNPTDVTIYYVNTDKWNYTANYKNE